MCGIVLLASMTTFVGVTSACADFFATFNPRLDYRFWVVVSTLLTTIVSTFGLDTLLRVTIPVLLLIYPTTVALVFLQFARRKMRNPRFTYGFTVAVLVVMSAFDTLNNIGLLSENVLAVLHRMPLFKEGIGWLLPGVIAFIISFVAGNMRPAKPQPDAAA